MLTFMRNHAAKILIITMLGFFLSIVIVEFQGFKRGSNRNKQAELQAKGEVATINGKEINSKYFVKRYNAALYSYKPEQQRDSIDPKLNAELQYYALMKTIEFEKYLLYAKKMKTKVSGSEVKMQVEAVKNTYKLKSNRELKDLLARNNYKYKDFLQEVRDELMVAKLMQALQASIKVTDEDLRNKYKQINARHILISTQADASGQKPEAIKEAARKKIADLYDQLRKGADFAALAKQYSEDPGSKEKGGDLGFFSGGQMVPEFERQAFALKEGEYSKPFESPYGFHIVKVEKIIDQGLPLDVDEKEEKAKLLENKQRQALAQITDQIEKNAKVEIFMPMFLAQENKAKGEYDKALGEYQLLASQNPQSPIPYLFTAEVYELKKDYSSALKEYQRALLLEKMYPAVKNPFTHFYLGQFYAQQKNFKTAAQEYQIAEGLVKDDARFLDRLKKAYQDIGYANLAAKTELKANAITQAWKMLAEKSKTADLNLNEPKAPTNKNPAKVDEDFNIKPKTAPAPVQKKADTPPPAETKSTATTPATENGITIKQEETVTK